MTTPLHLSHRSVISVSGADAAAFLNGILTVNTLELGPGELRYGALLTPQGKVIADLLISRDDDAILIDCASVAASAVLKRLSLMKLRAAVTLALQPELGVFVFTGGPDPRSPQAPHRSFGLQADSAAGAAGSLEDWRAARIAAGLPEQGYDFGSEEVFPADINMDLLGGVDFRKGCFVGQEVVSRMKRRGVARRRTLRVTSHAAVPAPILADDFEIGVLTSIFGGAGLARVRIDRLAEAIAKGERLTAGGEPVTFDQPFWLAGELAAMDDAKAAKS